MSAYDFYRNKMKVNSVPVGKNYPTLGERLKHDSDVVMEATWDNDVQSKICYIYDYFHDDQPELNSHMTYRNTTKTRIDAKFIVTQYGSISKDQVPFHIQFKPSQPLEFSQKDELYYFETDYHLKYDIQFPLSLYIDIPNEKDVYEKWIVVMSEQGNQFTKFDVLPCNYCFEWIEIDGDKRYKRKMWGCDRQQLSYTSGTWIDRYFHSLDNVEKSYLPLNSITENINYVGENEKNQRMIVSAKVKNPTVWQITKIENTHPIGLLQITFSQTAFNPHTDYIEKDQNGNIIGMWADYYYTNIEPIEPNTPVSSPSVIYGKIVASTSIIKVGGSYKSLTLKLYDMNNNEVTDNYSSSIFTWTCSVTEANETTDLSDFVTWLNGSNFNQKKIKFPNDKSYLNSVLDVKCVVSNDIQNIETVAQFSLLNS